MAEYIKRGNEQADAVTREITDTVSEILSAVQREGEAAVRRYSAALDGWQPDRFTVGREEIDRAYASVDDELAEHIERARAQVRGFAELQRQTMLDRGRDLAGRHLGAQARAGGGGWFLQPRWCLSPDRIVDHDGRHPEGGGGGSGGGDRAAA